jgi:putative oxidoreductase
VARVTGRGPARAVRPAAWALGRALVATAFVQGGIATLTDPAPRVEAAADFLAQLRRAAPWLPDDLTLVRINAATHVAAGALLAVGAWERQTAQILAASLVPTTIAGHPAWTESDPATRSMETIQLGKNLAMLGGLLVLSHGRASGRKSQQPG